MHSSKGKKIGLVLGSGAARGLAHIGIIKVLEKNNIPIDFIAGSSIGALIGGLYAATKDIEYVENLALTTNWQEMVKMIDPAFGSGFLSGDKVKDYIRRSLKQKTFDDLKIPFVAVTTDMQAGEPIVFKDGDLGLAIRASISMPFVFHTVKYDGKILCDGGLSMPVPVAAAKAMGAEYIIAVDLESDYFQQDRKDVGTNLGDMGHDVIMLLSTHLAKENMRDADLVIVPKVSDVKWSAFFTEARTKEIIARGEAAMEEALPRLLAGGKPKTFWQNIKDVLYAEI